MQLAAQAYYLHMPLAFQLPRQLPARACLHLVLLVLPSCLSCLSLSTVLALAPQDRLRRSEQVAELGWGIHGAGTVHVRRTHTHRTGAFCAGFALLGFALCRA